MSRLAIALSITLVLLAGCGGFTGRGRAVAYGRLPYDVADPSGTWIAEGSVAWGSGHVLEVSGPGPVFRIVRRDAAGQPVAFGVGVAEAGQLFVGYGASFEVCQVAVFHRGAENVEGVWAGGTSPDLGTEEWQGVGLEDPFVGDFATYGTNPGTHAIYRQRVATVAAGMGVYDVRWYASAQEFYGTGVVGRDRFATGAVLAADEGAANVSWFARGYGVAAYDLTTGEGTVVVRNTPEAPSLLGREHLRRP
ncbi:MAG: hypothetical protein K1X94_06650 [Sandaracinaceae bacterium]|nr:hypothetical protein [Sandaracinaceae bacterium]